MKISDILHTKGDAVVTISPDASVLDLVQMLTEHNIGAVIVSRDGHTLDGIVSERDVVRNLAGLGAIDTTAVSAIMTAVVQTSTLDSPVESLRAQMTEARVRHVPVVEDGKLVGIVSIGDVVKSSIGQLEFERDQLSNYVNQ